MERFWVIRMYTTIEKLQQSKKYHYIDYIPFEVENKEYLELENFFEKTFISDFAKKINNIILKMIYYLECEIYLLHTENLEGLDYDIPFDTNIREKNVKELSYIIQQVVIRDVTSLQIYFKTKNFLISINGGFLVTIYNLPADLVLIVKKIIEQEGLVLKVKENDKVILL